MLLQLIINDLLLHTVGRFEFENYAGPAHVAQTAAGRAPREPGRSRSDRERVTVKAALRRGRPDSDSEH